MSRNPAPQHLHCSRSCLSSCRSPNGEPASQLPCRKRKQAAAITLTLLLLAGCHSIAPPTPLDQLNAQQRAGYTVFQTRCAVCHYERADQPKNGPALVGVFKKPYLHSGAPANDERVTDTILHGHGLMPAQPTLDPDDLQSLLAYLHTV